MKRALAVIGSVAAVVAVAALLFYSRAIHPQLIAPTTPLTYHDASGRSADFPPSHPLVASVRDWVAAHQSGWHLSFVSYASQRHFSCDTFTVEVGERYVVLNYARRRGGVFTELTRDLAPAEQSFWRDLLVAATKT